MQSPRRIIVTSLLLLCLFLLPGFSLAASVATITHLSGPLAARKGDGSTRALQIGSRVDEGDTVITQKRTYARIKFSDGSEVTLKPDTQFKVEQHRFDPNDAKGDAGSYRLIKGGLRTITGQIGKRGNRDSYRMNTPTATIGIRGTIYDATYCIGGSCGSIKPGLYLAVSDGQVVITNTEGITTTMQVQAGQYVYVQSASTPPVLLPAKPDIPYNPPQSVTQGGSAAQGGDGAAAAGGGTDCIVR